MNNEELNVETDIETESENENLDCDTFDGATYREGYRQRSTGPRIPEGKAISAQNATKHGCRNKTLILRDEDPEEYEALHQSWWDQYNPSGQAEEVIVKQLIDNHWFLMRASKRLDQVDWEMPTDAYRWSEQEQKLFNNFLRYKTAAERAFNKSLRVVQDHYRNCERAKMDALKADLLRAKIEGLAARQSCPSKPAEPPAASEPRPERRFTPLAEAKAQWVRETGGFLGPIKGLNFKVPPVVPTAPTPAAPSDQNPGE